MSATDTFEILLSVTARNLTREEADDQGFNLEEAEDFGDEPYDPANEPIDRHAIAECIAGAFHPESVAEALAGSNLYSTIDTVALKQVLPLRSDVARLVLAARAVAFGGLFDSQEPDKIAAISELDQASEAFAALVPWEDEPA